MTLECWAGLRIAIDNADKRYLAAIDAHQDAEVTQYGAELEALWDVWEAQQISRIWTFPEGLPAQQTKPSPSRGIYVH